jgi:hypothetical protein
MRFKIAYSLSGIFRAKVMVRVRESTCQGLVEVNKTGPSSPSIMTLRGRRGWMSPDKNAPRKRYRLDIANHLGHLATIPTLVDKARTGLARSLSAVISADRGLLK